MNEQLIASLDDYPDDGLYELKADNQSLLLVIKQGKPYVVENKCGHFGVPMDKGRVTGNELICPQHGISFDLVTGKVVNRPYENCDPIKVFSIKVIDNNIYLSKG